MGRPSVGLSEKLESFRKTSFKPWRSAREIISAMFWDCFFLFSVNEKRATLIVSLRQGARIPQNAKDPTPSGDLVAEKGFGLSRDKQSEDGG